MNGNPLKIITFDKATDLLSKKSIFSRNQAVLRLSWIKKLFEFGKKIPKTFACKNSIIIKPAEFDPCSQFRFDTNVYILQNAIKNNKFLGEVKFQDMPSSKKVAFYCANKADYNRAKWLIGA